MNNFGRIYFPKYPYLSPDDTALHWGVAVGAYVSLFLIL